MQHADAIGDPPEPLATGSRPVGLVASRRDRRVAPPARFSAAFQPIVDLAARRVFAFEALVRGPAGESAGTVLAQVHAGNRGAFDQAARQRAIALACAAGLHESGARLSINFLPTGTLDPVRTTLAAARRAQLDPGRLILELVEHEPVGDVARLREIFSAHRQHGISSALDDFGAAHSGLVLLAELDPDIVKLDMALIRGIESSARRRSIVAAMVSVCREAGILLVAEGIETAAEAAAVRALGIDLVQGFLFGRPAFERLEPPLL